METLRTIFGPLTLMQSPNPDTSECQQLIELSGTLDFLGTPVTIKALQFEKSVWCNPAESDFGDAWGTSVAEMKHILAPDSVRRELQRVITQALVHRDKDIALNNSIARSGVHRELVKSAKAGR
jgi:hypothetical protein